MRLSKSKEKRRRECLCHFGGDDIVIENIRFNPVNVFPVNWIDGQEMSFYMDDGDDIYLLTIRNSAKRIITVFHTRNIRDIVMEFPISENNPQLLQEIVQMLHSIPYAQKIRLGKSKTFDILQFPNDMKYDHKRSKIR